jgi:hypothetical protein
MAQDGRLVVADDWNAAFREVTPSSPPSPPVYPRGRELVPACVGRHDELIVEVFRTRQRRTWTRLPWKDPPPGVETAQRARDLRNRGKNGRSIRRL